MFVFAGWICFRCVSAIVSQQCKRLQLTVWLTYSPVDVLVCWEQCWKVWQQQGQKTCSRSPSQTSGGATCQWRSSLSVCPISFCLLLRCCCPSRPLQTRCHRRFIAKFQECSADCKIRRLPRLTSLVQVKWTLVCLLSSKLKCCVSCCQSSRMSFSACGSSWWRITKLSNQWVNCQNEQNISVNMSETRPKMQQCLISSLVLEQMILSTGVKPSIEQQCSADSGGTYLLMVCISEQPLCYQGDRGMSLSSKNPLPAPQFCFI